MNFSELFPKVVMELWLSNMVELNTPVKSAAKESDGFKISPSTVIRDNALNSKGSSETASPFTAVTRALYSGYANFNAGSPIKIKFNLFESLS